MRKASVIALLAVFLSTLPGCGSEGFVITHEDFQASDRCEGTGTYQISVENNSIVAQAQDEIQVLMLKDGLPSIWCDGLTHQFVGTVVAFGYEFESDPTDPLEFLVDKNQGYRYVSGKGTVTDPDGKVTTLP